MIDRRVLHAVMVMLGISEWAFDFAADAENTVARRYYTEQDDALVQPWTGYEGWGWCNPPYRADLAQWAGKAYVARRQFGSRIALILPAKVGSAWWLAYVHRQARVLFLRHCHSEYPDDMALVLYSPDVTPGYEIWDWKTGNVH